MRNIILLLTLLISHTIFCQSEEDTKAKAATILENYFDLEREAIHLHLCKTTFLTNESIWYQGYVFNRKTNKPFFTSNIFVLLYDEKGTKLSEKLVYANNGVFSGKIDLNSYFHSGIYYIQVYTNWMNNFSENESTIRKIQIGNPLEGLKNYSKINLKSLEILLNPEGGHIINGVNNNIGIQIKDCRGNAPQNCEAILQNEKGEILNTIKLSQFGFGKFEYYPTNDKEKIVINYNNTTIEKSLPIAEPVGFSICINNYSIAGKTLINIKTNTTTQKSLASKKLYLLIHQDQKYSFNNVHFTDTSLEQTISFVSDSLSPGINSLRLIDSDMNEHAFRTIYIPNKTDKNISIKKSLQSYDQINLTGHSSNTNAIASTSIVPENSKSLDYNDNIFAGITINPYLVESLPNANYYLQNKDRTHLYELDLVLLNQPQAKYDWNLMKVSKLTANYSFDIGIDIKGTIDPSIKNKTYHKVKLVSKKNMILLTTDVSEKGEYNFEHVLLPDSTYVEMSLLKLPDFEKINTKITPQIINRKRPFNKSFNIRIPETCNDSLETLDIGTYNLSNFLGKVIHLEEVKIDKSSENKLRYANQLGNANLRGYKIEGGLEHQTLFRFIEYNGFNVASNEMGETSIYSRRISSFSGSPTTPLIFVDGRPIYSTIEIETLYMDEIDEIYLSTHAIIPNIGNHEGIIKIYMKKKNFYQNNFKKDLNAFYINEGFAKYAYFKNANYQTLGKNTFNTYGLIDWSPNMHVDSEGNFSIQLTDYNNQKGKTNIEGITPEGIIFQEEIPVDLK